MIQRGLQLIAVVGLLGAAPLYAQSGYQWPGTAVVTGLAPVDGVELNGTYILTGAEVDSGTYWYTQFSPGGSGNPLLELRFVDDASFTARIFVNGAYRLRINILVGQIPLTYPYQLNDQWRDNFGGLKAAPNSLTLLSSTPPPDPYEEAFPDWESAVTTIPLGFTFAMAFWGVAVAASMAMRWVKELASAAS